MSTSKDQFERTYEEQEAYSIGCEHACTAATWVADGNTSEEHIRRVLRMMEDGDPMVDEYLPNMPNLSGEWADDPTPYSLYEQVTHGASLGLEATPEVLDALSDAYEQGVSDTFYDACEAELRKWIS